MNYSDLIQNLFQHRDFPEKAFYVDQVLTNKPIILYGAGESSHWFVEIIMKMHQVQPVAVLDKKFSVGDSFEGTPAYPPEEYHPPDTIRQNALVIICVTRKKYHQEIISALHRSGLYHYMFLFEIYEIHNPFNLPSLLAENGFRYYLDEKEDILKAAALFEDDLSREIFYKYLKTHFERKPVPLPESPRDEQYFPADIPLRKGYSHFIHCGAYDGDFIRVLHQKINKIKELICFEPELSIYHRLTKYLELSGAEIAERIISLPLAVYGKTTLTRFKSSFGLGSRIADDGDTFVQTVTLDSLLPTTNPTFISMDIEGVEPAVLHGAEKLLRRSRPDLGICIYHSVNHIWEIPLFLNSLDLGYTFYLRNYTSFSIETVLYATVSTPENKDRNY